MTHHPTEQNHLNWWLTGRGGWRRLHAVPAAVLTEQQHRDAIDAGEPIVRFTVCGSRIALAVPGMTSRTVTRRCVPCCRQLGIRTGRGTPVNEASTVTVEINVRVPDFSARTMHPTEPNAVTCPECGEPYVSEWIDLSRYIVGDTKVAVGAKHTPCPAKPAPGVLADNTNQET